MSAKEFKTIEEQISILRNRGLDIIDIEQAYYFLLHNNYYRISGYSLTLRSDDVFHKNITFQNIIDIYNFDFELRHILLKYIEIIEVSFKSIYAYEFTKQYGATGYLNSENFLDVQKHSEIIEKVKIQQNKRLPHEPYLKHFIDKLKQEVPLWAYVDLLTISDISLLYKISRNNIKQAVAERFNIIIKGPELLVKFMHSMTIIRNLCAHGVRIYNRLFEQKPSLNKKQLQILRKDQDGFVDNAHLFGFLLIMQRLLKEEDFTAMFNNIYSIYTKYSFVKMSNYGFPDNWIDLFITYK